MPRLIDADALKESIQKALCIRSFKYLLPSERIMINKIDNAQTVNEWTSIEDKLPDKSGKYLVTITSNVYGKPFVKTAWFLLNLCDNGQFKYECEPNVPGFYNGDGEGDWVERSVTHWMPLPEPPEEVKQNDAY